MSKTYLQLVNAVQTRLREKATSSVGTTAKSGLIGQIVNDAKREVEDAWNWVALRQRIIVTTTNGTFQYALTGAGKRFRLLNDATNQMPAVYNDTQNYQIRVMPSSYIDRLHTLATADNNPPTYVSYKGQDSNDDPYVVFYPTPDQAYSINFEVVVPQDTFTSDSDMLKIPARPVELLAWAYAVQERGEDVGASRAEAYDIAAKALADAIAIDAGKLQKELDFYVI